MPAIQTKSKHRKRYFLASGLGLVLIALFLPKVGPPSGHWYKTGWDALHLPGFAVITWSIERLMSRRLSRGMRLGIAIGGGIAIGVISECVHGFIGRSTSLKDFSFDLVGIGFAAIFIVGWDRWKRTGKAVFWLVLFLALAAMFKPSLDQQLAENSNQARFPDIGGFAHSDCLKLWRVQGNAKVERGGDGVSLRVHIGAGKYGGVSYWPGTQDWANSEMLCIELMNPGEPFLLGIRIDDRASSFDPPGSWYSGEAKVLSGVSTIQIPLQTIQNGPPNREIDISGIIRLALFTGKETVGRVFIINSAFLK